MKQINIRISEERYEAFKEYCFKEKTSMTSFLLSSIDKVLEPAKEKQGREEKNPLITTGPIKKLPIPAEKIKKPISPYTGEEIGTLADLLE